MAYQNSGTSRFYISVLQFLKSLGKISYQEGNDFSLIGDASSLLDINPTSLITLEPTGSGNVDNFSFKSDIILGDIMPTDKNFFMVLGHNFDSATVSELKVRNNNPADEVCTDEVVNSVSGGVYDGFTIMKGNDANNISGENLVFTFSGANGSYETDIKIGSLLYGTYWDAPRNSDLNVQMSREFGGIKTIETRGGASLSNSFYNGNPDWGDKKAWQLGDLDISVGGRRVWDLSWSFLSDSSVFPDNPTEITALSDGTLSGYEFEEDADDFTSIVLKYLNGNQLPFVFQPDNTNNSHDQFAICKLSSTPKFSQVAPNMYNIKLKIREVW